jgi:hypothetical protein
MDQNDLQSMREVADHDSAQAPLEEEPGVFDRFVMAITSPREAFEGLLSSERLGPIIRWGLLLAILVGLFGAVAILSSPEMIQKQMDAQRAQIEKKHDAGKMTDQQYEATMKAFDSGGPGKGLYMGFAIIGVIVFVPVAILLIGLLVYIISRILQTGQDPRLRYSTALAVVLTGTFISCIDTLVKFVGIYVTKDPQFAPDLSLVMPTDNAIAKMALSVTDPFTIWWLLVMGVGIAAISKSTWAKSVVTLVVSWLIVMIAIGAVRQAFAGFGA